MKNIYDYKHVRSVSAYALLQKGKYVGKIICNWSDNPAGSVCTAQVMLWDGKISPKIKRERVSGYEVKHTMIGKAGGYGYDKLSSAIYSALERGGIHKLIKVEPGGGNVRKAFEDAGFELLEVC